MNVREREHLKKLDELILNASPKDLKKIQAMDYQTQMEGLSFYDVYLDSSSLINQSVKKRYKKS